MEISYFWMRYLKNIKLIYDKCVLCRSLPGQIFITGIGMHLAAASGVLCSVNRETRKLHPNTHDLTNTCTAIIQFGFGMYHWTNHHLIKSRDDPQCNIQNFLVIWSGGHFENQVITCSNGANCLNSSRLDFSKITQTVARHETFWGGRSSSNTYRSQPVLSWCMFP